MNELDERLARAKTDGEALSQLLRDYLPFVKKQLQNTQALALEYDDKLSLAMLTFVTCARQYTEGRGGFLSFCATCIRNRLIDEARRQGRQSTVPLHAEEDEFSGAEVQASLAAYDRAQEKEALAGEIAALTAALAVYGVALRELPRCCPKQGRARRTCMALARCVAGNADYRAALTQRRQLPQAALALRFSLSPKTIEKHRKYIVTLAVLLLGDYPAIRAFLPQDEEVT